MTGGSPRRAVVVGAGLGGLAAGLRLARAGWSVTVCERNRSPGGKMNRWSRAGFTFDTGPSLLTLPHVFERLYRDLGTDLREHLELVRLREPFTYVFPDASRFRFSSSLPGLLAEVARHDPEDREGLLRFLERGARLYRLAEATFLRRPLSAPPDRAVWRELARLPLRGAWGRYDRAVASCVRGPRLRQILNRYPTYVGSSPYETPATLSMIPYMELAFGHWFVRGGLYRVVESLVELGRTHGVELRGGCEVTAIRHQGGRVVGVETGPGETLPADAVIVNGEASRTEVLIGRADARPLPEPRRSLSGLVILIGLRRRLEGIGHHAVYFSADYEREFADLFARRRFPEDPTVYVNVASRTDAALAPPGGETLYLMANAPAADGAGWDAARLAGARARIMATLRRGGFPDLTDAVAVESAWTPERLARAYGDPGGAIYGQHSHGWRGAFLRPPNRHPRIRGLYQVGGSAHPGGGTPTVLLSARIVAELVHGDLGD